MTLLLLTVLTQLLLWCYYPIELVDYSVTGCEGYWTVFEHLVVRTYRFVNWYLFPVEKLFGWLTLITLGLLLVVDPVLLPCER